MRISLGGKAEHRQGAGDSFGSVISKYPRLTPGATFFRLPCRLWSFSMGTLLQMQTLRPE